MVRTAIRTKNLQLMAEAGMVSAEINQQLLPKPLFDNIRDEVMHLGAEGVMVAHSGSLLSVVLDPAKADYPETQGRISRFLDEVPGTSWFELSNYDPPSRLV
jgi:L-threonine kinase